MKRDELIEKVAFKLQLIAGDEYDYDICGLDKREASRYAEELLDTIYEALKEPTRDMYNSAHGHYEGEAFLPHGLWQAMLAASPLSK